MREPITGMTRTNQCTRERSASMYSDSLTGIAPLMRYYGYGYHGYGLVKENEETTLVFICAFC